ncbi:hypothetical protein BASA81_000063 [Batrachochytrium salamandrivorans]|nr:hypothetical protein BASA81_000063 [Batrachochytrium salamandrivorans]
MKQSELEALEIEELEQRIASQAPGSGRLLLDANKFSKFADFPLSSLTLKGLQRGKFVTCTEIQKQTLLHALSGRDILGASKTGSGKTLAFLVPLVEDLFRMRVSRDDANTVFGLVVSPTRELSAQIYEMAKVLTSHHAFNIGLLVGGSEFKHTSNVQLAVGTPGRILQHLEQSPQFDVSQLAVLVFDEADRLLDMGFSDQIGNILSYLPPSRADNGTRQTMLFSATQTRKIKDLALLSMTQPEFVSCFAKTEQSTTSAGEEAVVTPSADKPLMTPKELQQQYIVCDIAEKLSIVHEFLQQHCEQRSIVFFTSCKQVKFVETCFRRMRIGLPVYALHGKQTAEKRRIIYDQFCEKKGGAVLFATDVASRGLDFPHVDWVVQADCPEDAATYIHRVGRTARYEQQGKALLLLLPSEEMEFVRLLREFSNINLTKKQAALFGKSKKKQQDRKAVSKEDQLPLESRLQDLLVKDPELKLLAQKAFKSYLRSVHFQPNTLVFDLKKLSFAAFAQSLGLGQTPRIKFSKLGGEQGRKQLRSIKNQSRQAMQQGSSASSSEGEDEPEVKKTDKISKLMNRQPTKLPGRRDEEDGEVSEGEEAVGNAEDFFTSKSAPSSSSLGVGKEEEEVYVPKKQVVKKPKVIRIAASGLLKGAKSSLVVLDDDEEAGDKVSIDQDFVQRIAAKLKQEDEQVDRGENRKRVKEMHKERKKLQKMDKEEREHRNVAVLAGSDDDDEDLSGSGEEDGDLESQALRLIQRS